MKEKRKEEGLERENKNVITNENCMIALVGIPKQSTNE